jgi:hypothetical protein
MDEVEFVWGGQVMETYDFIGISAAAMDKNIFVVTGDSHGHHAARSPAC